MKSRLLLTICLAVSATAQTTSDNVKPATPVARENAAAAGAQTTADNAKPAVPPAASSAASVAAPDP
ncbi:MAG TPA: hypothetical protein VH724_20285, partial [Candidatus Angelobacter sp.]|nr:hypothetical protein [Candidatus Angelobacter sp.]